MQVRWYAGLLRSVAERWTAGWQHVRQQLHQWICRDSGLLVVVLRYAQVSAVCLIDRAVPSRPTRVARAYSISIKLELYF